MDNNLNNNRRECHEEYQYLKLIENIIDNGFWEECRNGKTKSIFGSSMRFSLKEGKIPILTTKKTAWKTCLKELLWFIKGQTDNKILQQQGVHIWDGNSTKEFLNNRGLSHYPEGHLGPIYGYQWRNFNAPYQESTSCADYSKNPNEKYIDQLQYIIEQLKDPKTRNSRRLVMSAWNPNQIDDMALPPCHILCQFNVHDGNKLSCSMYQRSVDCGLGQPFNIASYCFLTHLLAKHCDLQAHEFVYFMGNTHIYESHIEPLKEQLKREPYEFPTLEITDKLADISAYTISNFLVSDYKFHPQIKMHMYA